MASSTVSSWMMGSCMSVGGEREHDKDCFFGISKSKRKGAAPTPITRTRVFPNSKSNTHFSSSSGCGSRRINLLCCAQTGEAMEIAAQPAMDVALKKKPPTKERRVVVTGMGVATPVGHDPNEFYENLLQGASGISEIEAFDCSNYPTRIAGEIKSFSTDGWVAPKLSKRMDKFMLYMLTAGKKALSDAGITEDVMDELDKRRCGVLIGSALGGMKVFNDAIEALRISYRKMNPFCVPFATTNMGSAMLAMDLGWMGPNCSISTACATSNFCMLNAAHHIIRGEAVSFVRLSHRGSRGVSIILLLFREFLMQRLIIPLNMLSFLLLSFYVLIQDMMLCGESDAAIIPIGLGGFVACRALSQQNSDLARASRPWDSVMSSKSFALVLLSDLNYVIVHTNFYVERRGNSRALVLSVLQFLGL